jgi:NADH-quinone oxidoreductase subunit G
MGEDAIEAGGRGAHTVIGTYGGWLNCSQCGNCIEVCPTGTLLDATYRHQTRPWELSRTTSTCSFCSDGCQFSVGSRRGEVLRVVARDRYVNGHNGEFLCIKGRFAHPFVNHEERLRTPLVRYKKGGRLVPSTWEEAIRFAAQKLQEVKQAHGGGAIGVVGSPRLTNESNWALLRFAREVLGTDKYTATEAFSLTSFFENLSAPLATHRDIRHAKTIVLIGGEPEELQPLTGKQVRQAVRNGGAKLVIFNSVPIRLKEQAAQFIHIRPGSEDAVVLALSSPGDAEAAAGKLGVEADEIGRASQLISETVGDVVLMFGGELSAEAQAVVAQLPAAFGEKEGRRFLFHPLPLFNNSVGVHDLGLMNGAMNPLEILDAAGTEVRAMYVAGGFLPAHLEGREDALTRLDFLAVQELFLTGAAEAADVVFPAASFAETDGTFTNSGGLVQRVRQSIPPVNNSRPDWAITSQLASALGVDLGFQMSSSTIFLDIARSIPAYEGLRYPLLKDESKPVQARHALAGRRDVTAQTGELRRALESLDENAEKISQTPPVGHELFKLGVLTSKVAQFHLLAAGNPEPESVLISPLYQITIDPALRREAVAGD